MFLNIAYTMAVMTFREGSDYSLSHVHVEISNESTVKLGEWLRRWRFIGRNISR